MYNMSWFLISLCFTDNVVAQHDFLVDTKSVFEEKLQ